MRVANGQLIAIDCGGDQDVEVGTVFEIYLEATHKGRFPPHRRSATSSTAISVTSPWRTLNGYSLVS